jgi:general secretion pathway protein D
MIAKSTFAVGILAGLGLFMFQTPVSSAPDTNVPVVIESVFAREMSLRDFAELMTRGCAGEWKVLVSERAGDKRVSFYLSGTGIEETLRSLCATHGLWFRRSPRSEIVQIVTMEEYQKGVNLYADEAVEIVTVKYPSPEEIGDTLARLFQDRVVWDPPPEDIADDMNRIESALNRMDTIADRATLVDGESTSSGSRNNNNNSSSRNQSNSGNRNNSSSISGHSSNNRATEEQTAQDVVEQQRRTSEAQRSSLGVSGELDGNKNSPGLVYVSTSPSANALVLRSSDTASVETIKKVIQQLDKPKPQVLLEIKVFELSLSDEEARGVDWLFKNGSVSGGQATGITADPGNAISASDAATLIPQGTGVDPRAAVFSYVSDQVKARIQLLQDEQRVRSLATPSLLVADSEASRIFIGSEVTVLEKVEQEQSYVGEDNVTAVTTYEVTAPRKRIGTTLLVTPKIHADRTVTIRLLQEETELGSSRTIQYGKTGTDQFTSQDVEERSVTTTVVAKDGENIAIGGLIRKRRESQEIGVPGLMKIPYLGSLFKRNIRSETHKELLILIRPKVLLAPGEGEAASLDYSQRARRHETELNTDKILFGTSQNHGKATESQEQ